MIDIIGNIHLKSEQRKLFFFCTKHSLLDNLVLNNEYGFVDNTNRKKDGVVNVFIDNNNSHGDVMIDLINKSMPENKYFLNFEEDHFFMVQKENMLQFSQIIKTAEKFNVDTIRCSFFEIENMCASHVPALYEDDLVKIIRLTPENFEKFCKPAKRFYIGTNCIFKKDFALKLFARNKHGKKPHDYEVRYYESDFEYTCLIPKIEILRSIDDDHGLKDTCLLNKPTPYFTQIYNQYKNAIAV